MADGYRAEADEAEAEAVEAENDERDEKKKEAHGQDSGSDGERMIGAPSVAVEVVARRALAAAVRGAAAVLAPRALTRGPRRRGRGVGGGHLGACRSGDGEGEAGGLHPPDHGALALHVAAAAQRRCRGIVAASVLRGKSTCPCITAIRGKVQMTRRSFCGPRRRLPPVRKAANQRYPKPRESPSTALGTVAKCTA